jgi:hypothetical protein
MPATFSLSLLELDIVDDDLRLGRWVHPFQIPYASPTFEERKRQREAVWQALTDDRLATGKTLVDDVEETLQAWAKPEVLITQVASVLEDGSRYLYRGGWRGDVGFMSRQEGDQLIFDEGKPEQVVLTMVGFLPQWAQFRGLPVTTTTPASAQDGLHGIDRGPTNRPDLFGRGQRFFDYPLLRYGAVDVSVSSPRGRLEKQGTVLWFDSVEGRFMLEDELLPDRTRRRTFTPTSGIHVTCWINHKIDHALAG